MTISLKPIPGELRATIEVKRAATGLVEQFEVVGHSDPVKLAEIQENRRKLAAGEPIDPDLLEEKSE